MSKEEFNIIMRRLDAIERALNMKHSSRRLTVKEFSDLTGKSPSTIRRYVSKGFINGIQNVRGGKLLFDIADVERVKAGNLNSRKEKTRKTIL